MRRMLSVVLVSSATGAAALASGCGAGDTVSSAVDPVAQAADTTIRAGSVEVRLSGAVGAFGQGVTISGRGTMSTSKPLAEITATATGARRFALTEVLADGKLYLHGSQVSRGLPHGKTWVEIRLLDLLRRQGAKANVFDQGGADDATQALARLRAGGQVHRVGEETIFGVRTTHYHALIDVAKAARLQGNPRYARFIQRAAGARVQPYDVWIDAQHRVRRMRFTLPNGVGSMTMDLVRFGVPLHVSAPSPSVTYDVSRQVERQLARQQPSS